LFNSEFYEFVGYVNRMPSVIDRPYHPLADSYENELPSEQPTVIPPRGCREGFGNKDSCWVKTTNGIEKFYNIGAGLNLDWVNPALRTKQQRGKRDAEVACPVQTDLRWIPIVDADENVVRCIQPTIEAQHHIIPLVAHCDVIMNGGEYNNNGCIWQGCTLGKGYDRIWDKWSCGNQYTKVDGEPTYCNEGCLFTDGSQAEIGACAEVNGEEYVCAPFQPTYNAASTNTLGCYDGQSYFCQEFYDDRLDIDFENHRFGTPNNNCKTGDSASTDNPCPKFMGFSRGNP